MTKTDEIIFAVVLTAATVIGITVYAFVTDTDFTLRGSIFAELVTVLSTASFAFYIFNLTTWGFIIAVITVIFYVLSMLFTTHRILGGANNKFEYDDFIQAVLVL
jgi:FtsH-binding integral membrane protein